MVGALKNAVVTTMVQRWLTLCTLAVLLICALADYQFFRIAHFNSDTVQNYNELSAIAAGNYFLHGWSLATDNFYLTDLPFYVLFSWIFGTRPALIQIVPLIMFTLFLLACVLIVRWSGKTPAQRDLGTIGIIILLGFPFTPMQALFRESAVHGATIALAAWGFLLGQRLLSAPRGSLLLLLPFSLIVFAVVGSDPQVEAYFPAPLLILVVLRAWMYNRIRLVEWALFACVLVAGGLSIGFIRYITLHGGFQLATNYALDFVPTVLDIAHNFHAFLVALQMAFDARPYVLVGLLGHHVIAISRFVTALLVGAFCLRIIWRAPRAPESGLAQWLVLGAICLAAADVMSGIFARLVADSAPGLPIYAVRYVIPIFVFMSVAAVIEAQDFFQDMRRSSLRLPSAGAGALLAVIFLAGVAQAAVQAARQPDFAAISDHTKLAAWLRGRHFTYGVGDYWITQTLTALGRGAVIADPVDGSNGKLVPLHWVNDLTRVNAKKPPQFVAFMPVNGWQIDLAAIVNTYGAPREVDQVGPFTVVILN